MVGPCWPLLVFGGRECSHVAMTTSNFLGPSEWYCSWSICAFLDERFVELPPRSGVDLSPAVFAVILQTGHVGAEKWRELATAPRPLALITQLVIQNIRLDLHLENTKNKIDGSTYSYNKPKHRLTQHTLEFCISNFCSHQHDQHNRF